MRIPALLSASALLLIGAGCSSLRNDGSWVDPNAASKPDTFLSVWAEAEPDQGPAPLTVTLTCDPITRTKDAKYVWTFADGTPDEKGNPVTHTFTKKGRFRPRVTVTDGDQVATDEVIVDVE